MHDINNKKEKYINQSVFIALQYSNCYETIPLFYLMIFIGKTTLYMPICYYEINSTYIKDNFKQFYTLKECTIYYDPEKLLLHSVIINDKTYGFQDNIMDLYYNLDDCKVLLNNKQFIINDINQKITMILKESENNIYTENYIYGIKFQEIIKCCDNEIINEKNIRNFLSKKLIENNNLMNQFLEYDIDKIKNNINNHNLIEDDINLDTIECNNIQICYNWDRDPFNPQLTLKLNPINLNHTDYGYAYQMLSGGYNVLLYNYNSVLENVNNYFKQLCDLISLLDDDIIKLHIKNKKTKKHIIFENTGLIGEIRKIYTPTKNGNSADHLMIYCR